MKFPYGLSDVYDIITDDYFYIDRTDRIPLIEEAGKYLLFLRPRRFGKSLLLSMLKNYYDAAKADEFDRLFGHLAISKHPTPLHNQYFILKWDFSAVSPQGQPREIEQRLHRYINGRIDKFIADYQEYLTREIRIDPEDAMASFQSLLTSVQQTTYKLYLLIDEYDNFANEIMMAGREISANRYQALVYGEGCLKAIFKVVKASAAGEGLDRTFITGVSPVVMSDITSGHNIAKDVYLRPEFNDLCGFHQHEIYETLRHIVVERRLPIEKADEALAMMQAFYNGYAFTYNQKALLYNPTLALYFLEHLKGYGEYPRRMLDSNLAMDKGKITYISSLPHGEQVIIDALSEQPRLNIAELADRFGVEDMLYATKDNTFMTSILYYFGVLTLSEQYTELGELIFKIPNLVIRKLYVEQIKEMLLPEFADIDEAQRIARQFYHTGDLQPLCEFMEQRYFKVFDNRDYRWANELIVKTAFLTLLFNDTFYIMDSETALDRKYADLTMIVRPDMRQYQLLDFLIEFKYLGLAEHNLNGEHVGKMNVEELISLTPVKKKFAEAKTALEHYEAALKSKYGESLRLRVYSLIAVGFDRIVWQKIENRS